MRKSPDSIESILEILSRQLWLVTAADGDRRGGLVATWVSQVSLHADPLVMAVSLGCNHFTRELVDASGAFALHLIADRHSDLALTFATCSGRDVDKLAGVSCQAGATGAPRIADVTAWMECRVTARIGTGDRVFYWAEVVDGDRLSDEIPLTDAAWIDGLSAEDRGRVRTERERSIRIQKPLFEQWLEHLPKDFRP